VRADTSAQAGIPRTLWWIVLATIGVRLAAFAGLELYADEAYYWTWSLRPDWGYFDHPPMVAWLAGLSSHLLPGEPGVRLLFVLCGGGAVLFAGLLAGELAGSRAAVLGGVFAAAAPMLTITGALALPDAPQELFFTSAAWCLVRRKRMWLVGGLAWGLALLSKYPTVLLGPAVGLVALLDREVRDELRTIRPWLGGVLALLLFSPCILWNARHQYVSFRFQLEHGFGHGASWESFTESILAVFAGVGVLPLPLAIAWFVRDRSSRTRLLAAIALLPLLVVVSSAARSRVEANWSAVVFPALCAAAGAETSRWSLRWSRVPAGLCAGLCLLATVIFSREVRSPHLLSPHSVPVSRFHGWKEAVPQIVAAAQGATFAYAATYQEAGELAYYGGWRRFGETYRRPSQFNLWGQEEKPRPQESIVAIGESPLNDEERSRLVADPGRASTEVDATFAGEILRRFQVTPLVGEPLADLARHLPETIGTFRGEGLTVDPLFVRRAYVNGEVRVDVTLAPLPQSTGQNDRWAEMSAGYPSITILASADGSGFYDCNAAGRCDAHLQLRSGVHVELMAQGTARREDLDPLLSGLQLSSLGRR
jgi:4-amino-4-deoxy-L-arabinose transferase-like glycosyltransferase